MISLQMFDFVTFLVTSILVSHSEGKTEIGDYIVDCSACNSVPVQGVSSYSCTVRCEAQGEYYSDVTHKVSISLM